MAVQHLVVDDDDVGEAVDRLAAAVNHGDAARGRPAGGLTGPVHLDHVGHHAQQRVRARGLRGQQRLGGLAQARLVCQQERAVSACRRGEQSSLVGHQLEAGRQSHRRARLGQLHARRRAGSGVLERAQQRLDQRPAAELPLLMTALLNGVEVGREEWVGQLRRHHRPRDRRLLAAKGGRSGSWPLDLRVGLQPARDLHLTLQPASRVADLGVLAEQSEQRRLAGRGLRQDRRDPVQPLQLCVALPLVHVRVGLHPRALVPSQQRDGLELRRLDLPTLHACLDLAHRLGKHGQNPVVVAWARVPTLGRPGPPGTTLALCQPDLLRYLKRRPARAPAGH